LNNSKIKDCFVNGVKSRGPIVINPGAKTNFKKSDFP
jgi:hypothetical protein